MHIGKVDSQSGFPDDSFPRQFNVGTSHCNKCHQSRYRLLVPANLRRLAPTTKVCSSAVGRAVVPRDRGRSVAEKTFKSFKSSKSSKPCRALQMRGHMHKSCFFPVAESELCQPSAAVPLPLPQSCHSRPHTERERERSASIARWRPDNRHQLFTVIHYRMCMPAHPARLLEPMPTSGTQHARREPELDARGKMKRAVTRPPSGRRCRDRAREPASRPMA